MPYKHVQPADLQQKMFLVERLDARITRSKDAERHALIRGMVLGVAMLVILQGWSPGLFDEEITPFLRYGFTALIVGSEYLVRRLLRRGMERDLDALIDRSTP